MTDRELRKHIDLAVGRALVDHDYEQALLADPAGLLGQPLVGVHALSLVDFASEAWSRFWGWRVAGCAR